MTSSEYLEAVLKAQNLDDDSKELKDLQKERQEVEDLLCEKFIQCSPTIRYGGSKAKRTLIRESYDLDIICYFPHDDTAAGETLEDIYKNTRTALETKYMVEEHTSALRLAAKNAIDIHVDVVPGRYVDDAQEDTFLYQSSGEKKRLKTNLDVHIEHIRDSGVRDAIRLLKLWRVRNAVEVRVFALELLTIELLKAKKSSALDEQLEYVLTELRDNIDDLKIEDPANPTGNDLSGLLNAGVRLELSAVARSTLQTVHDGGWEKVFGPIEEAEADKREALRKAAGSVSAPTRPWRTR